jgi:WhiB family redox-sensing transcriptional regulator
MSIPADFFSISRRPKNEWAPFGNCLGKPTETFYTRNGAISDEIRELCETCPVRLDCLVFALVNDEHGIWGGTTRLQRSRFPKEVVNYLASA